MSPCPCIRRVYAPKVENLEKWLDKLAAPRYSTYSLQRSHGSSCAYGSLKGGGDEIRTRTPLARHRGPSPARLPIPATPPCSKSRQHGTRTRMASQPVDFKSTASTVPPAAHVLWGGQGLIRPGPPHVFHGDNSNTNGLRNPLLVVSYCNQRSSYV